MKAITYRQMRELEEMGISVPSDSNVEILDGEQIKRFYPKRARNSHKGTYGSCNIVAGSKK